MGPRVFTVEEANALLEAMEGLFRELDELRGRMAQVKQKMDVLEMIHGARVMAQASPDSREYKYYLEEAGRIKQEFEGVCRRVAETGANLKSVDEGLVDFCGVIDGRLVELCWKRGEARVEYYHHIGEGFAGRQAIPERTVNS